MKILMVANNDIKTMGGIETHIRQLSTELKKNSQVTVAHLFPSRRFLGLKKIPKVADFNKISSNFDVLHFHGFSAVFVILLAFFAKKQNQVRWVYTPHMHPFNKHRRAFLAKLFFHILTKHVLKKIDKIIVLSNHEKGFFLDFLNIDKIALIPNGIESVNQNILAKKMRKHFLFIGRYEYNKRPWIIEKIAPLFPQYHFVFVTNKQNLVAKDNIIYHYNISDSAINALYSSSLATIIPSKYEAFSMVALESLAAGTPIIITQNVQIKEYLTPNVMVLIEEKNTQQNLIYAIQKIINTKDSLFYQSCQDSVQIAKQFLWSNIAKQTLNHYQ